MIGLLVKREAINISRAMNKQRDPFVFVEIATTLFLAFKYLSIWISPSATSPDAIAGYGTLIAFEFIMVHSGVMMAVAPRKIALLMLVPFYGVFALAFNAFMPNNEILWLYLFVVLGRMRFAFSDVNKNERIRMIVRSVGTVLLYFFLLMFVAFLSERVPLLGMTKDALEKINYFENQEASGLFVEKPQTAMAMGAIYFTLLSVLTVRSSWQEIKRMFAAVRQFLRLREPS